MTRFKCRATGYIDQAGKFWRRDIKDAVILFAAAFLVYAFVHFWRLPEKIRNFALVKNWVLDDFLFASCILSVALVIFGYRRYQDISRERKARLNSEAYASKLAQHDPLTGLLNRNFFAEYLGECIRSASPAERVVVLTINIDNFQAINNLYGTDVGDNVLLEVCSRLSSVLMPDALLGRVGPSEFSMVMTNVKSLDEPANMAARLTAAAAIRPFGFDAARELDIGISIGISVAPDDTMNSQKLLSCADRAVYRSGRENQPSIRFYKPEMDVYVQRRIELEQELRTAITSDLIRPYYQPVVSLDNNGILGFESLARWENDKLGHVPPGIFIRIAEELGLIDLLTDQLLRRACADATEWPSNLFLAFNISAIQLRMPTYGLHILAILAETNFSPLRLEIEITEGALVTDIACARRDIDQLRQAGIRISLDDFGTGYASLAQLLSFHFDKIKIDQSFVFNLLTDKQSSVIVQAVLGLAKGLGLTVTAEGIESADILACLKKYGCAQGQGYFFSKAVPADQVADLLKPQSRISTMAV